VRLSDSNSAHLGMSLVVVVVVVVVSSSSSNNSSSSNVLCVCDSASTASVADAVCNYDNNDYIRHGLYDVSGHLGSVIT